MRLDVVDAKKHPLGDANRRALAGIETHPKVQEWDVDIHTADKNTMCALFARFLKRLPKDERQTFLVGKLDGKVIGFLGIYREDKRMRHVGMVGISIHPDYWEKGFGTKLLEASVKLAKEKDFLRLEADTLAKNKSMRRIAEKVGFRLEGKRKARVHKNGRYEDEALLAMLLTDDD